MDAGAPERQRFFRSSRDAERTRSDDAGAGDGAPRARSPTKVFWTPSNARNAEVHDELGALRRQVITFREDFRSRHSGMSPSTIEMTTNPQIAPLYERYVMLRSTRTSGGSDSSSPSAAGARPFLDSSTATVAAMGAMSRADSNSAAGDELLFSASLPRASNGRPLSVAPPCSPGNPSDDKLPAELCFCHDLYSLPGDVDPESLLAAEARRLNGLASEKIITSALTGAQKHRKNELARQISEFKDNFMRDKGYSPARSDYPVTVLAAYREYQQLRDIKYGKAPREAPPVVLRTKKMH